MDPDVVEIPPPLHQNPSRRSKKQKQSVYHDVIDLEADEDLVVLGETSLKRSKGKAVETVRGGYGDHQVVPGIGKSGTVSEIQSSNGQPSLSRNVIIIDGEGSKPLFVKDDYLSKFSNDYMDEYEYALLQAQFDNVDLPNRIEVPFTFFPGYDQGKSSHLGQFESAKQGVASSSSFHSNFGAPPEHSHGKTSVLSSARVGQNGASAVPPGLTTISDESENETLKKLQSFKRFDTVIDPSDHHFVNHNSSMKHHPKSWAKKIQEEWKILEKHLPDTIFVRVYESRMDILRAVIIGAEGTPYHDGLFFFDVHFPNAYPSVPPLVHYHSGGLRLNPNLYDSGYVCLSLLNTWYGNTKEMWTPGVSTMLQVLVSIQGLILNARPFFNEPGYASMSGSKNYEVQSLSYNENTFILSVRTMMYMIKKLPKNFEDLVRGHFYSRAHDILASCKAYMEDVQVGSFVKGGVQNIDKGGGKCSDQFKVDLFECVKLLVQEFEKIGVKDCQKFMSSIPPKLTLPKMTMKPTPPKLSMKLAPLKLTPPKSTLPKITMKPTPPKLTMKSTPPKPTPLNLNPTLPKPSPLNLNPTLPKPTIPKMTMKPTPSILTMKPTPVKHTPLKPPLSKMTMKSTPSNVSMNLNQNLPYVTMNPTPNLNQTLPYMTMNQNLPYVTMNPTPNLNQNLPYVTMNPTPNQNLPYMTMNQNLPYVTMNPTPNLNQNLPYVTMNPTPNQNLPYMTMNPSPKLTMKRTLSKMTMKHPPPNLTPLNLPKPTLSKMTMKPTPPILTMKPTPPKLPLPKMTMKPTTSKLTLPKMTMKPTPSKPTLPKMTMKPTPPILTMKSIPMKRTLPKLPLPKMTMKLTPPNMTPLNLNLNPTLSKSTVPKMTETNSSDTDYETDSSETASSKNDYETNYSETDYETNSKSDSSEYEYESDSSETDSSKNDHETNSSDTDYETDSYETDSSENDYETNSSILTMKPTPPNPNMSLTLPNLSMKPTPPKLTMKPSPPKLTPPKPTLPKLTIKLAPLQLTMKLTSPTRVPLAAKSDLLRLTT